MAKKRRPKELRERVSDTLERITLRASHFTSAHVFTGKFEVTCPRCRKPASIDSVCIGMQLSCGCAWHPPRHDRGHDEDAWLSYSREERPDATT